MKFNLTKNGKSIDYWDVRIYKNCGKLDTYLYLKPTDSNQSLLFSNCHPLVLKFIWWSQRTRVAYILSYDQVKKREITEDAKQFEG